jgi:hypothetical protein
MGHQLMVSIISSTCGWHSESCGVRTTDPRRRNKRLPVGANARFPDELGGATRLWYAYCVVLDSWLERCEFVC